MTDLTVSESKIFLNRTFGLNSEEAARRLKEFGKNEILASNFDSRLADLKRIFLDPMGLMLLCLAALYALIGEAKDAVVLLIAFIPVTAVDVVLELRSRNALRALRATLKKTTKVLRDGIIQDLETERVVVGDVILFEEGQALPADGKVIEAEQLSINEASLTGESQPIEKSADSLFFGGTVVLQGRGLGLIEFIGKETRFGKIASLIEETEAEKSPLQKKVNHLVGRAVILALILALLLLILEYFRTKEILKSIIVAVTFGMAAVPEEFPLVFTLYLSLGAWRLSKHGVLVKSLPSVEALGSVDVICTDKTGTLTEGRFQLEDLYPLDSKSTAESLWQSAIMACEEKAVDSMDIAILEKANRYQTQLANWHLEWDYPFEQTGKHMSHVWQNNSGQAIISMKGAVEGVLEHCQIDQEARTKLLQMTDSYSSQGKRILGLAMRSGECVGIREADEQDLKFLGLLVFSDPIRSSVKNAIAECQAAGISIKMLTGDHPLTAHSVADETGIYHAHEFLFTGTQLSEMSKEQRWQAYKNGAIFSRLRPEQKHEMVQALKESGNVVAMTGDGINDAPALKLADIGISMGQNATDVARSTAQMILLKNNFNGIVEAVFEGRRIFSNLKRSFSYLISFHAPVIFLALLPPVFGWGDLLLPIHIVLLELIVHPVSAFAFENLPETKIEFDKSLLPAKRFFEALTAGILLSAASLFLFRLYLSSTDLDEARTLALTTVFFGNIAFIFVESWPLRTLRIYLMVFFLLAAIYAVIWIPAIGEFLHLKPIDLPALGYAFAGGVLASIPTLILRISGARLPVRATTR